MRKNKESILKANREVGRTFARGYRYLKAAAQIYEDSAVIYGWAIDEAKSNAIAKRILDDLFSDEAIAVKPGKQRKLFASAITPDGLKNYLQSILCTTEVIALKGVQGTGTEKLLEKVKSAALERGYNVECYYCALNPGKLEHLVIPDKDISFTTVNKYHNVGAEVCIEADLNSFMDKSVLDAYADVLEYNESEFDALLNKAIATISEAKAIHDHMETFYIPNMDFEAVQTCFEATLARIIDYANELDI